MDDSKKNAYSERIYTKIKGCYEYQRFLEIQKNAFSSNIGLSLGRRWQQ